MFESKLRFEEPELEIKKLSVIDIITTSDDWIDDGDWDGGEF